MARKSVPVWEPRDHKQEINSNTVFDMQKEVILAIQNAVAEEITETESLIFDWLEQQLADTAEGPSLDTICSLYGVDRVSGESDDSLKTRLVLSFVQKSISVSRSDIESTLEQILGTDEFVIIPRTGNSVWLIVPRGCLQTKQEFADLEDLFPVNTNLKISVYERKFASASVNTLGRPMGSFFLADDLAGSATTLIYNKEAELYGN